MKRQLRLAVKCHMQAEVCVTALATAWCHCVQAAVGSGVEDVREVRQRLVSLETGLIKKQRQEDKRGLDLLQKLSEQEVQASPRQSPLPVLHSICTARCFAVLLLRRTLQWAYTQDVYTNSLVS